MNISIYLSILAIICTFISVIISFRQGYANVITTQRFTWMDHVREEISGFIAIIYDSCLSACEKKDKLSMKALQIELYIDTRMDAKFDNNGFLELKKRLYDCIDCMDEKEQTENCLRMLIEDIQNIMANTHIKAKKEAGILGR